MKHEISILRVVCDSFNLRENSFAILVIMIREKDFSTEKIYSSCKNIGYKICSEIRIDKLIYTRCKNEGGKFWQAYKQALEQGISINAVSKNGFNENLSINAPRFSEEDFKDIIEDMGGRKILETESRTPDFEIRNFLIELKDIQEESLEDSRRQENIANLFKELEVRAINLDPTEEYGQASNGYRKLISRSISEKVKDAAKQIKSHPNYSDNVRAGVIILNTGMFSINHEDLIKMVGKAVRNDTRVFEFAFILSQVVQNNGFNSISIFQQDYVGNLPAELADFEGKVSEKINEKMNAIFRNPSRDQRMKSQVPISFFKSGKIFYWSPGRMKNPWDE